MAEIEIPIFPLPDLVFFPGTLLPLHVFEPRYRRMVADCLVGDRRLAVVMLRPGWEADYHGRPPVHEVAGAGEIAEHEPLPDGRSNILLHGVARVRIAGELPAVRPYRIVRAEVLEDRYPPGGAGVLAERLETLRAAYLRLLEGLGRTHPARLGGLEGAPPAAVVDRIASAALPDATLRQQVLETADVAARLELVASALLDLSLLVSRPEPPHHLRHRDN